MASVRTTEHEKIEGNSRETEHSRLSVEYMTLTIPYQKYVGSSLQCNRMQLSTEVFQAATAY